VNLSINVMKEINVERYLDKKGLAIFLNNLLSVVIRYCSAD
jgi:hypothetical protein